MAVFFGIIFIIGALGLALFSRKNFWQRISNFGLFLTLFLVVGSLANGIWACSIYNHLYHSYDYIFDFIPFRPVTLNADPLRVDGYGTTLRKRHTELSITHIHFHQ
jgi:hypothetical protein